MGVMKEFPERTHSSKRFLQRRRYLRNNQTPEEAILWEELRGKSLGYKFRRQHSIGAYILDFYCPSKKLGIEIDGGQHILQRDYDKARDKEMEGLGIRIIRFSNEKIRKDLLGVLRVIGGFLEL
jgi:very-short-patch-repair endonuclease